MDAPADTGQTLPPQLNEYQLLYVAWRIVSRVVTRAGFASFLLYKSFKALGLHREHKQVVYDLVRGFLGRLNRIDFILRQHGKINFAEMPLELLNFLRFETFLLVDGQKSLKHVQVLGQMAGDPFYAKYGKFAERVANYALGRGARVLAEDVPRLPPRERIAIQHSFPGWLVDLWADAFGEEFTEALCQASNIRPPQDLRANVAKRSRERVKNALLRENVPAELGTVAPHAIVVPNGIEVFKTTSFRRALFEMTDQGSQLAAYLVDLAPGDVVLDYCAGTGGKTLHMASIGAKMVPRPRLYASDIRPRKLESLLRRVKRAFPDPSIVDTVKQTGIPELAARVPFMKIFVDAPCSGLGNVRRNPGIKVTASVEGVGELVAKQAMILRDTAALCRPGARLIYVTCSINPKENEEQALQFAREHPTFSIVPYREALRADNPIVTATIPTASRIDARFFSLYPNLTGTEGFFGAIFQEQ